MRPRHWQQLGAATGRVVVADERLTLGTMLDLQLHRCAVTVVAFLCVCVVCVGVWLCVVVCVGV